MIAAQRHQMPALGRLGFDQLQAFHGIAERDGEIADIVIETGATSVAQIVAQVIQRLDGINKTCGIPSCTP